MPAPNLTPRTRPLALLLVVGLALGLTGCGSADEGQPTSPTRTASELATPTEEMPSETASPEPGRVTALTGVWKTEPITIDAMERTLRSAGHPEWTRGFRDNAPISDRPTVLILEIGDEWDLSGRARGGQATLIDYNADYRVRKDRVEVVHSAGSNTFRWQVRGAVLRLIWLRTTFDDIAPGVPEEAFQRALYMTADFRRQS